MSETRNRTKKIRPDCLLKLQEAATNKYGNKRTNWYENIAGELSKLNDGVSADTVKRFFNGKGSHSAAQIARHLGLEPDDVLIDNIKPIILPSNHLIVSGEPSLLIRLNGVAFSDVAKINQYLLESINKETIKLIVMGEQCIVVNGSINDIIDIYTQYQNNSLNEIAGFSIEECKILNNKASKSTEDKEAFSRELVKMFRSEGFAFVGLSDMIDFVRDSFLLSSEEIINRLPREKLINDLSETRSILDFSNKKSSDASDTYLPFYSRIAVEILEFISE